MLKIEYAWQRLHENLSALSFVELEILELKSLIYS